MRTQINPGRTLAFTLALLVFVAAAQAKTLYVDGSGKAEFQYIREAVSAANSGDTIVVERGTYSSAKDLDVEVVGKVLTIRSRDPNNPAVVARTIIDCQGSVRDNRAFIVQDSGTQLTLAGLTITNGLNAFSGGAVLCEEADLNLINCTFTNNAVEWWGGAVYCRDSRARFGGCTFSGNSSQVMHGGAVFCTNSRLELVNCSFKANKGGALENLDSDVTLSECVFQDNNGRDGGAIYSRADANLEKPTYLSLTKCKFASNSARSSGGALYNYGVEATFDACTFTSNKADQDGGAVYNHRSSPALANCAFIGNTAVGTGGAVLNVYGSSPGIINCTFVANTAGGGGAVAGKGDSDPLISHCILWNNTAARGRNLYLGRYNWGAVQISKATVEYSDVQDSQKGVYAESGCELDWASGNIDVDPLFTGPVQGDYRLSPDSPCINAGDANYFPEPGTMDLDGKSRRFGSAIDIGAYEFQGLGPVYRFWSPVKGKHFYTITGAERDKLISEYPHVWTYEDVAYYAFYEAGENLLPVYRFWSDRLQGHVWTMNEEEVQHIMKEYAEVWAYEGVVFYAYPAGRQPLGTMPVYRFWSGELGHHFYTMDENEKNKLIKDYPHTWEFEGTGWYAYAQPYQPGTAAYEFAGGAEEAWYALTLSASVDGRDAQITAPDVRLSAAEAQMQMTINFTKLTTTLDKLYVQTRATEHDASITQSGSSVAIPMTLTIEASFNAPGRQGPFTIDPTTGVFADFTKSNESLSVEDPIFMYRGSVVLGNQVEDFDREAAATRFELEASGTFEAITLLPEGIYARLPFTFQWHRQYVKDLLAEASVNGHLVQLYVTYAYVSTQGLWKGKIVK